MKRPIVNKVLLAFLLVLVSMFSIPALSQPLPEYSAFLDPANPKISLYYVNDLSIANTAKSAGATVQSQRLSNGATTFLIRYPMRDVVLDFSTPGNTTLQLRYGPGFPGWRMYCPHNPHVGTGRTVEPSIVLAWAGYANTPTGRYDLQATCPPLYSQYFASIDGQTGSNSDCFPDWICGQLPWPRSECDRWIDSNVATFPNCGYVRDSAILPKRQFCSSDNRCFKDEIVKPPPPPPEPICGNGIVENEENCNTCPQDFTLEACEVCGDGICTNNESQSGLCGLDCGEDEDEGDTDDTGKCSEALSNQASANDNVTRDINNLFKSLDALLKANDQVRSLCLVNSER